MRAEGDGASAGLDRSEQSPAVRPGRASRAAATAGVAGARSDFRAEPFRPARWLPGAHLQTVGGRLLRPERPLPFRRERLETPDGDFLDLDFAELGVARDAPLVLLLHGLEGSARRGYALNVYRELAARGIAAAGLNFRSCGGELNRTARFYHSGDTGDIRFVLERLAAGGRGPLGAIGFSLGGNALLKYLGEDGERSLVQAAVAVSVPYDLAAGALLLERSRMGRFYARQFLRTLTAKAEAKQALLATAGIDLERVRAARSFREFDDAATAPLHGFASAADYYARSSSAAFLPRIRVPTLLLQAADDPFLPDTAFPAEAVRANRCVVAERPARGGHVGFIQGPPWRPVFWAEREAARFLAERLTGGAHSPPDPAI